MNTPVPTPRRIRFWADDIHPGLRSKYIKRREGQYGGGGPDARPIRSMRLNRGRAIQQLLDSVTSTTR